MLFSAAATASMAMAGCFANRPDLVSPKRAARLSGHVSPLAKKNFQALGWTINEKRKLYRAGASTERRPIGCVCAPRTVAHHHLRVEHPSLGRE
jgi:hypothetical protein